MGIRSKIGVSLAVKAKERHIEITEKKKERKDVKNQMTRTARWMNETSSIKTPTTVNRVRYDDDKSAILDRISAASEAVSKERGFSFFKSGIGQQKALLKGTTADKITNNPANRTPLFEGLTPNQAKLMFHKLVDTRILDTELEWAEKFGAYFKVDYAEWAAKVNALFDPLKNTDFSDGVKLTLSQCARDVANSLMDGDRKLTPLSFEDGKAAVKKGKNAGAPFFTKKWNDEINVTMLNYYVEKAERIFTSDKDVTFDLPAFLFTRNTPNADKPKMRPVECPEGSMKWLDIMYQVPLTKKFQTLSATFGYNGVQEMIPAFNNCFENAKHFYSLDFSAFDASVRQEMMDCIFDVMFPIIFDLTEQHACLLRKIKEYYLRCDLMTPTGVYTMVEDNVHGLFSGMGLTSVIGTLSNLVAIKFGMDSSGYDEDDWIHFAFGDDTVLVSDNEIDLVVLSQHLATIGFKMNVEKTHISSLKDIHPRIDFLGCHFLKDDVRPIRSLMRALPGLVFVKNDSDFVEKLPDIMRMKEFSKEEKCELRAKCTFLGVISKLANLYAHQQFEAIIELVVKHSPKHWFDLDWISEEESSAILMSEIMDHPILDGSKVSAVMRYIRELYEF